MARPIIITCAVTGGGDTRDKNPAVPVTPAEIADSAIGAAKAGASIVHIHVRDPATGKGSTEFHLYEEVVDRIRSSGTDAIINLTTGAGASYIPSANNPGVGGPGTNFLTPEQRVEHILRLRPEMCTLDVATMNFGERVFMNTPAHLRTMAALIKESGALPELEAFEPGHVELAKQLIKEGLIAGTPLLQLCLGISWGTPATAEGMLFMRSLLPSRCGWSAFGISRHQFPMAAQAFILGGNVRVGLEDNLYLDSGVLAPSNAALVERAADIVRLLGGSPAAPAEARTMLGIGGAA